MNITINKMIAIIGVVISVTGSVVGASIWVYSYHKTLATRIEMENKFLKAEKDSDHRYVNLRIIDVENSIRFYQRLGIDNLDSDGKSDYNDLRETRKMLKIELRNILGFTK